MSPSAQAAAACSPPQPAPVFSGSPGSTVKIPLHPPAHGWCKGRYDVTVFLQRTPVCGPPIEPGSHLICPVMPNGGPAFRTSDLNAGETHFTVR